MTRQRKSASKRRRRRTRYSEKRKSAPITTVLARRDCVVAKRSTLTSLLISQTFSGTYLVLVVLLEGWAVHSGRTSDRGLAYESNSTSNSLRQLAGWRKPSPSSATLPAKLVGRAVRKVGHPQLCVLTVEAAAQCNSGTVSWRSPVRAPPAAVPVAPSLILVRFAAERDELRIIASSRFLSRRVSIRAPGFCCVVRGQWDCVAQWLGILRC